MRRSDSRERKMPQMLERLRASIGQFGRWFFDATVDWPDRSNVEAHRAPSTFAMPAAAPVVRSRGGNASMPPPSTGETMSVSERTDQPGEGRAKPTPVETTAGGQAGERPSAKAAAGPDANELDRHVSHSADSQHSVPHVPSDRDERVGVTDGAPSAAVHQGHRDLERGIEDTSKGEASDATYDRLKKPA